MTIVREATSEDKVEIARLLTLLGHPTSEHDISERWAYWVKEGNICLVKEQSSGMLAGLATMHKMFVLHRRYYVGRITVLVVDEPLRGQGVGRELVAYAERFLKQAGCNLIEITSNKSRIKAHEFYQHLGYERTSERFSKVL